MPRTQAFLDAFHASMSWGGLRVFLCSFGAPLIPNPTWTRHLRTVHDFVDHHVDMAIQNIRHETASISSKGKGPEVTFQHESVLLSLMKHTKDREEVRWQILHSMLAMSDTCSTLASNVLFLLSREPSIWKRLRHEIRGLDIDSVTVEVLTQLSLLRSILKEGRY